MKAHITRVISIVMALMMVISVCTVAASATTWSENGNVVYDGSTFGTNGYYNVISQKTWTLVPGAATETEIVLNNSSGNRRQVLHVLECDPSNPDISIIPGYYNIEKDITDVNNWTAAGMTDMAAKYEDVLGYNVVCGMNTALAYDNNAPYSWLVYNGQVLVDRKNGVNNFHSGYCSTMLCVYKDAETGACSCELRTASQGLRGDEWQAIGANFAMTVNNGVLVSKTEERTTSAAARSMIGVKEDGTLVLVMNDGRGANNSIGFCTYELGESMLALGCKWAFNCDGGGSSGFVTKRAGETAVTMRSVPCDGAERPTINGVFIVSNVGPTGELNNVDITADYDYFAPGTSYTFGAAAIDTHGYAMDMPADVTWSLSDAAFGTIADGTFTSNGTEGDVDIQVESAGAVVGTKTIHIANPTSLSLSATETTLPYSTAEKVRTITLPMVAMIGENEVYTDGAYDISASPANGGIINGLKFTATDDTSITQAVITITYLPTSASFTYTVNYGKGSEVLWDFEDGDISAWVGTADADQMMRDHGCELTVDGDWSTPFRTLTSGGQISWSNTTTTALSSKANGGQAHSGDKSLAVTFDMKNVEFNSWVYSIIWNMQGNVVLRDVANGQNATAFGCWVYVPKGFYTAKNNGAQALQLTVLRGTSANAALTGNQLNLQYNGKNINALKESDIPENRWIYVKASLTAYNYIKLVDPYNDVYRSPSFIRMYVKPSEAQEMTYYFDDWTLDYSSAVDDREPPVISNPTYCTYDENIAFNDQTLDINTVSFNANIADTVASNAEGLDYASAKIYVDGVAIDGVIAKGNTMGVQNVVLSNGTHSIKFEIADKLGNSTTLTKSISINASGAKSAVRLAGHNDKGNAIEAGSLYYVDVVADAIEDIDTVTTTVELHSAHEWELDHMIVAEGFEASYALDSIKDNIATITITKTGKTSLTGTQTIVSLPARVWSFDETTSVGGDGTAPAHMTAAQRYASSYGEPVLFMEANVLYGAVTYTDAATGTFGGSISEATAVTGNKTQPWHEHNAEPMEDKAPTCTEEGYTGRTYCDECGSIIDWGDVVPTTGHDYAYVDGLFVCTECGDVLDTTGFNGTREISGNIYFFIAGNAISGWQTEDANSYYFDPTTFAAVDGAQTIDGLDYVFTDCVLTKGAWRVTEEGRAYYWAGSPKHSEWAEIEGETYHFDRFGIAATGYYPIAQGHNYTLYHFSETGALIETIEHEDGIFFTPEDEKEIYYFKDGYLFVAGLVQYNYEYYYFPSNYKALRNTGRYIDDQGAHGYVPAGYYEFDDDCHIIYDGFKNGVQEDGTVYKNGIKIKAYKLVEFDNEWYFVAENNKIARDQKRYLNASVVAGTDFAVGYYYFDADGKYSALNGPQADDSFYINDEKQKAYKLCQYQGDWYLVAEYNKIAKDQKRYLNETVVAGTPFSAGYYYFDAEGKYSTLNGPKADGYFYLNDVKQTAYSLHEYEDNYYFVVEYNKYAVNARRYLTAANLAGTPFSPGYYNFDEDGKMIVKNGAWSDGYFYNYNVQVKAYSLVEFEGDYYFIAENNKYVTGVTRNITADMIKVDGIVAGKYEFAANGKMVYRQGPNADGYFYRANQKVRAYELCEYNGDYYLVAENNKFVKSATRRIQAGWLKTEAVENIAPGSYEFDADGKMILD